MRTLRERYAPWGFSYRLLVDANGQAYINQHSESLVHEVHGQLNGPGCSFLQTPLRVFIGAAGDLPGGADVIEWESISSWIEIDRIIAAGSRAQRRGFKSFTTLDGQTIYRPDTMQQKDVDIQFYSSSLDQALRDRCADAARLPLKLEQQMRLDRVTEYCSVTPTGITRDSKSASDAMDTHTLSLAVHRRYVVID